MGEPIKNREEDVENLAQFYNESVHITRHKYEFGEVKKLAETNPEEAKRIYGNSIDFTTLDPVEKPYTEDEIAKIIQYSKQNTFTSEELKEIASRDIVLFKTIIQGSNPSQLDPIYSKYYQSIKRNVSNVQNNVIDDSKIPSTTEEINKGEKMKEGNENLLNEDDFYQEDLKDSSGNTVKDEVLKEIKLNGNGQSSTEFLIRQIARSVRPEITFGLTVADTLGFNPTGMAFSGKKLFNKTMPIKDRMTTTNLDYNFFWNIAPDALIFLSKLTDNRKLQLGASLSPAVFQLIANTKERKNPFIFSKDENGNGEIDIIQALETLIPFGIELLVKPLIRKLNLTIPETGRIDQVFSLENMPKLPFGNNKQQFESGSANSYFQAKRNIKQPSAL